MRRTVVRWGKVHSRLHWLGRGSHPEKGLSNDIREVFTLDRSEPLKSFGVLLGIGVKFGVVVGN